MFEWLADAQHVGTNNPNNLPPYTTFDAGVTAQLTRGTLTFAATQHHEHLRRRLCEPGQRGAVHDRRRIRHREHRAAARCRAPISVTYSVRFGQGAVVADRDGFHARGGGGGPGRRSGPGGPAARRLPAVRAAGGGAVSVALLTAAADAAGRSVRRRRKSGDVQRGRTPRRRVSFRPSSRRSSRRSKRRARRRAIRRRCRRRC